MNRTTDIETSLPAMVTRSDRLYRTHDLHRALLKEGFAELTTQFRRTDFEQTPETISFDLASRLSEMQKLEESARLEQVGPIWSKYRSEFTDYVKRNRLRAWKEQTINKIINVFK